MISISELKNGIKRPISDKEARVILDTLYGLAELALEDLRYRQLNGPIDEVKGSNNAVKGGLPARRRQRHSLAVRSGI